VLKDSYLQLSNVFLLSIDLQREFKKKDKLMSTFSYIMQYQKWWGIYFSPSRVTKKCFKKL